MVNNGLKVTGLTNGGYQGNGEDVVGPEIYLELSTSERLFFGLSKTSDMTGNETQEGNNGNYSRTVR